MRLVIVAASLILSLLLAVLSHGRILFFVLPLAFGLPLAGAWRRRR